MVKYICPNAPTCNRPTCVHYLEHDFMAQCIGGICTIDSYEQDGEVYLERFAGRCKVVEND
jgi:hypothetical protein